MRFLASCSVPVGGSDSDINYNAEIISALDIYISERNPEKKKQVLCEVSRAPLTCESLVPEYN